MKNLLNFKNIAIAVLIIFVLLEWFNPGGVMPGKKVFIAGKAYEVIKHDIDTVDIVKTKIVTKKGEDIYHETIVEKEELDDDGVVLDRDNEYVDNEDGDEEAIDDDPLIRALRIDEDDSGWIDGVDED
jgi:hypothetical protein